MRGYASRPAFAAVKATALDPLRRLLAPHIVVGSTSDAAHQKARDVLRFMPARLFYVAVAESGVAFGISPMRYSSTAYHEDWVYVHAEFFHVEHAGLRRASDWAADEFFHVEHAGLRRASDWAALDIASEGPPSRVGKRASTRVSLVRLAAVLRHARVGYARMAKAAGAIAVVETREA